MHNSPTYDDQSGPGKASCVSTTVRELSKASPSIREAENHQNGVSNHSSKSAESEPHSEAEILGQLDSHKLGLWLALSYSLVTIATWAITVVSSYKPINFPTYYDHTAKYNHRHYLINDWFRRVVKTLMSLLAAISIPITSAVCAKAAAVYCQRVAEAKTPKLTMRQTLALADKGWSDLRVLSNALWPHGRARTTSPFLLACALLCGIGLLIPALQGALVNTVHLTVSVQMVDTSSLYPSADPQAIMGLSPDALIEAVSEAVVARGFTDLQPNLWFDGPNNGTMTSFQQLYQMHAKNTQSEGLTDMPFFTSSLPLGTDTGVESQVGLRLNSSLVCKSVPQQDFPAICPGNLAFVSTFSNINSSESTVHSPTNLPLFSIRLCAPRNSTPPWTRTHDRQDIQEDIYLDFEYSARNVPEAVYGDPRTNFTQHCQANTTMGYFEFPNIWNNHTAGPLLKTAPNGVPNNPMSDVYHPASPGPLVTSILAIFGNGTFFDAVVFANDSAENFKLLCPLLRVPFSSLFVSDGMGTQPIPSAINNRIDCNFEYVPTILMMPLYQWLINFQNLELMNEALNMAVFFSNEAMLNPNLRHERFDTADISSSPGMIIQKFQISPIAIIIISALIVLQLTGLLALAVYASSRPTWTESLDSFAILRLGAAMADELPLISSVHAKDVPILDEKEGWIGEESGKDFKRLAIGGCGHLTSNQVYAIMDEDKALRLNQRVRKVATL